MSKQIHTPKDVQHYYNEMTASYLEIYGDVIQAFRPTNTEKLLDYIGRNAGINWSLKVLDLGCGVAGPAIHFAKRWNAKVDAVTISEVQFYEANYKIKSENLETNINIFLGDYHQLEKLSLQKDYDVVVFLESLGHSNNVELALQNAFNKLKSGGTLYIKDFYKKEVEDKKEQEKIDKVIDNINYYYAYNTLNLNSTIEILNKIGFKISFIQAFGFTDDISVRYNFELKNNIDIFEGQEEFYPADWLEIKCIKT